MRRGSWWWAYLALFIVANLVSILMARSPLDALDAVFRGFGLVCLWGYIRGLAVGWRQFWVAYLLLSLLLELVSLVLNIRQSWVDAGSVIALHAVAAAIAFPLYLANYRYAFKCPDIWGIASSGLSAPGR